MKGTTAKNRTYLILGWVQLSVGLFIAIVLSPLLPVDADSWRAKWEPLGDLVEFHHAHAWWAIILCSAVFGICETIRRCLGAPVVWKAIDQALTSIQQEVFRDHQSDPEDHHRVTLFRFKKQWIWPFGLFPFRCVRRRLVAMSRSGHLNQSRVHTFAVPDDSSKFEGIAGYAWRYRQWVIVPASGEQPLPDVRDTDDEAAIQEYARATFVTAAWVRKQLKRGKPLMRSFAAIRVQTRGQPWGVVVLDSYAPDSILEQRLKRLNPFVGVLTPLLEQA